MCVGTCARILGPGLLILGLLSIIASLFLLFPNWESRYLNMGLITKKAILMPGLWGGGMLVSGYFSNLVFSRIFPKFSPLQFRSQALDGGGAALATLEIAKR
ncbi:hypothetical protein JD844_007198 [Phrynosoma platyrhinos]|uniref:Uncharacterized protein n=1 Tax=Phrynosoma platyrhinos TaxID=52577 RepID=A0ABQ7T315_PHRPL|nr:hypothetical protein JD844_007198 [Phrynosoma platyrhinos]